ncbi:nucleotide modification associated domain-containing protein [Romboutsia sp.]|uniref:nucleotide modification associated domain-containing protein n=1 Tax=Romboutsia sp. TaxID=1965302 RepID=UPI002CAE20E3|nr:nucleotide modification associated domain-containing protein [Romboutsia sp.]HSQ90182.1 nucleotide modification associated domain-containing protein [Romboutsia sp.]
MFELRAMTEEEVEEFLSFLNDNKTEQQAKMLHPGKISDTEIHASICSDIHTTFIEKNRRYGNSFSEQFSEFGLLSLLIRLTDKYKRFKMLSENPEIDVLDEGIEDTLRDLANYTIMGLVELEKMKGGK